MHVDLCSLEIQAVGAVRAPRQLVGEGMGTLLCEVKGEGSVQDLPRCCSCCPVHQRQEAADR